MSAPDQMRAFCRRGMVALATIASLLPFSTLAQEPLRIQLDVRGVEELEELSASIVPEEILADPGVSAVFDGSSRRWVIDVLPAHAYLTELTVALSDGSLATIPKPPLQLALPYGIGSVIEITIPNLPEPDPQHVLAAYRGELPSTHEPDWLIDLLHASAVIDYLAQDHTADTVPITPPLMRSLVVYAERLHQLLGGSRWFGVPINVNERAEMIRRAIAAARSDPQLANNIKLNRLEASLNYLRLAESHLYVRAWIGLRGRPDDRCLEDFPVLRSFYSHLRQIDPETYDAVVTNGQFRLRTHVLLRSTECFRRLITIEPNNRRTAYPSIVAEAFGGMSLSNMAEMFESDLNRELRELQSLETANLTGASVIPDCSEPELGDEVYLCTSIAYIHDLKPLIVDEVLE